MGVRWIVVALGMAVGMGAVAQTAASPSPAQVQQHDAVVDAASEYIGWALFLRCFCTENNLSFDAQGKPQGAVKAEDWTLTGVNVSKVTRKTPGVIEMEAVRVAIRYAADRHEFERHPQKDDKMRITIADTGDPQQMEHALGAVFAVGIDVPLQRSMPDYWRHYFDPKTAWPDDELAHTAIYATGSTVAGTPAVTPPTVTHRAEPGYTMMAQRDRVKGTVQVRMVVDGQGVPRHITVAQPLGYGLDEKAVEAVAKFKFAPAVRGGSSVASVVLLNQEYVVVPIPQ